MGFAGIIFGLFLVFSWCAYWISAFNPPWRHGDPVAVPEDGAYQGRGRQIRLWMEEMARCPGESVTIRGRDGVCLAGRYYPVNLRGPVVILFHGYRSGGLRDLCGLWRIARANGQNVLVVDQRAQGRSGGSTITFGVREHQDCLDWVQYTLARFPGRPIFLAGVSMGGATVLLAAGETLPAAVRGIVADCPYTSAREMVEKIAKDLKLPGKPVWLLVAAGALLYGHFDMRRANTLPAVEKARVPILLIHGEGDRLIPSKMTKTLARHCRSPHLLVLFPQAGHGHSCPWDMERYEKCYRDFVHLALNSRGMV